MHRAFKVQRFLLEKNMSLINGTNSIALLSVMVGLPVSTNIFLWTYWVFDPNRVLLMSIFSKYQKKKHLEYILFWSRFSLGTQNSGAHLERRVGGSRSVKIWNGTHALYFNKFAWGYEVKLLTLILHQNFFSFMLTSTGSKPLRRLGCMESK